MIAILLGLASAFLLVIIDINGTAVILPAMQKSLHLSLTEMQWIINSYTVALACFVVPIGKLADRYGLKIFFQLGVIVFVVGSLFCALADNFLLEVIGRVIQGIGGATIFPIGLAIVPRIVSEEHVGRYLGFLISLNAIVFSLSGLIAGLIAQYTHWRVYFYMNIPVGIFAFILLQYKLSRMEVFETGRIDIWGMILALIFVLSLVFSLMESQIYEWSNPIVYVSFIIAIFSLLIYLICATRVKYPLVPTAIFKSRIINTMSMGLGIWQGLMLSLTFLLVFLQTNWGFSASKAGYMTLALGIPSMIVSRYNGDLAERLTPRTMILVGYAIVAISFLWLGIGIKYNFYIILGSLILMGFGFPMAFINSTTLGLLSVQRQYHGLVSGLLYAFRYTGGSVIFAVLGIILHDASGHFNQQHMIKLSLIQAVFFTGMALGAVAFLIAYWGTRQRSKV